MRRMRHLKPREIQGCQLALDASIPSSLYDATSGGSLVAPDGAVARWEDQSGNARHVTQSGPTARPLRRLAGINGCEALDFDGSNDSLTVFSADIARNVSGAMLYIVAVRDSGTAVNTTLAYTSVGTGAGGRLGILTNSVTNNLCYGNSRRLDADGASNVLGTLTMGTTPFLATFAMDYGNSDGYFYKNKTLDNTNTSHGSSGSTSNTASSVTSVGAFGGTSNFFAGNIAAVAFFGSLHNDLVRQRLQCAQMRKWRING